MKFLCAALFALAPLVAQAASLNVTLQGQSATAPASHTATGTYAAGAQINWQELDTIPFRVLLENTTASPLINQIVTVSFDHQKTQGGSTNPGLQNLTGFAAAGIGPGVTGVLTLHSATLTTGTGDVWTFTLNVTIPANTTGAVQFSGNLSAGSHNFGGASLNMSTSPSGGNLSINKPSAAPGTPDLAVVKTGPATAVPGGTVTYTLTYTNTAALPVPSSATGVQLTDTLPAGMTYVAGTATCGAPLSSTCTSVTPAGNQIVWNLGTLALAATGSVSFQAVIAGANPNGTILTNTASILSAENDAAPTNNISNFNTTVVATTTNLVVSSATGTYGGTVNLTATLTNATTSAGISGQTINFFLNGVGVGSATTNGSGVATLNNANLTGINAGTYAGGMSSGVEADFAGNAPYAGSHANNTLTVNKATPTATLAVTNSPQTYTGLAQAATVGITASSVPGSVTNVLTGGTADKTNAGTYAVTADFEPTDTTNYFGLSGLSAGNFIINKATPTATLAVTNSPQLYTGLGQAAAVGIVSSSVPGSVTNVATGGAATQTNSGTYAVTADFVPNDTTNYNSQIGLSAGDFVISKLTPTATLAVTNSPQTYTGLAQAATVGITTSSVPGSVTNVLTGGTPTQIDAGTYAVTADFVPTDTINFNSVLGLSAGNFVIGKATPTATLGVTNTPQIYTGSGQAATVGVTTSSVPGTAANVLTGGAATQIDADTYAVTADFVPNDTINYDTLTGLSAGNFVIGKATPTATLGVTNSPQIYTGSGQAAIVGVTASSVPGAVANVLTGGAATQTNADTYAVTADFVPTDTTNYDTLTGLSAGNFVIGRATPTATLGVTNSPQIYTGSGQAATVGVTTSSVPGSVANVSTGGAATQTDADTYAVTADFVPNDATNYDTLIGLSAGNFVIGKATPTATLGVTNTPQIYTGSGQAATVGVTASSVPGAVTNVLTGGAATQTNADTYAVTADFVPTDTTNYDTLTGLSAGNFVIGKATPTATLGVTNSPQIYTGSGQAATVGVTASSVSGTVANVLTGGAATQTNADTYAVTADFVPTDTANYDTLTGLSAGNFVIGKATPTATLGVTNTPQIYTGSGQAAAVGVTASSVPGAVANVSTGGAATQTTVGSYAVTADFVPTDTTNYDTLTGLAAGNFVIGKATPTATLGVTNTPQIYTGSGQAAAVGVTTSSVPGAVANVLTGGAAMQTNADTYAVTADFVPTDTTNYDTLTGLSAGNFVIGKATPTATLSVTNTPQIYTGSGQAATVGVTASSVPGSVANVLTGGAATQTNADTYAVTADFVPNDTANYDTLTGLSAGNFVIGRATPTATLGVTNTPQIYTGSGQAATVGVTASSVPGAVANVLTGGAATQTTVGTYAVTADFVPTDTTNYDTLTGLSAGNFVIGKATPTATLGVTNTPQIYTGSGQAATVGVTASSVPGAVANVLTGGAATQTTVGTYAVTADFVPTDTTNYDSLTGLSAGNFVIGKATPTATLGVTNTPQIYTGSGQAATVAATASSVPGAVANVLTGGAATQTSAGTYAVTADFVPNDTTNYDSLTGLSAGNFVIGKASPTATLGVTNTPQIYTGSGQAAAVGVTASSVPGAVANVLTGGAATQTTAGTYAVTADFVPTDTTNYSTLTGLSAGNFVISKATPTISWSNPANINYSTALSGTQLNATASVPGTLVYTPAAGTVLGAGNGQTLSVVFTPTDTANYTGANANVSINVLKAVLTVKADNASRVFGAANPSFTATITGYVNGDTAAVVTGTPSISTTATTTSNIGTYPITPATGSLSAANYSFSFANGTLTVTGKSLTVTATGVSRGYDGTNVATVNLTTDKLSGDDVTASAAAATFADKKVGDNKPVSVSGISISGANAGNYTLANTTAAATANITARAITVTAVQDNKPYDGTTASSGIPTVSAPGIASGDTAQFIQTFDTKNVAGSRTLTPSGSVADGNSGNNYAVTFVPVTMNTGAITAAAVQPDITAASKTYDGTTSATIATRGLSGVFPGDSVTLTGGTATFADANVGSGKTVTASGLTLTGPDAANYVLTSTSAATTADITKANQIITFDALPNKIFGDAPFPVTATASSGLPVALTVKSGPATISGNTVTLTAVGQVTLTAAQAGNGNYNAATSVDQAFATVPPPALLNISTRGRVGSGDDVLIGGYIVKGVEAKKFAAIAMGPSIQSKDLPEVVADTVLELHGSDGALLSENDNFADSQLPEIEASGLKPPHPLESAIIATEPPGQYTAIVRDKTGAGGIGLVALYDLSQMSNSNLANISTRGRVGVDEDVLIGGFIVNGNVGAADLILRAIGPSLTPLGIQNALANPTLELRDKDGALIGSNDNWQDDPAQAALIQGTTIPPQNFQEAAIVTSLPPANYTVIVAGKDHTEGIAVVEIYDLTN